MRKRIIFLSLPVPQPMKMNIRANQPILYYYVKACMEKGLIRKNLYELIPIPYYFVNHLDNASLVDKILGYHPDIVCFSNYIWNVERTLFISSALIMENIITVGGGPEIKNDNEYIKQFYSRGKPVFSYALDSEYLHSLVRFLNFLPEIEKENFSSPVFPLHFNNIGSNGGNAKVSLSLTESKLNDKDIFNEIFPLYCNNNFTEDLIYLETDKGCPFNCSFCSYGKNFTEQVSIRENILFNGLGNILSRHSPDEIYFLSPTFNLNKKRLKNILKGYKKALSQNGITKKIKLFAELKPQLISGDQIKLLADSGFDEIEIGIQSYNLFSDKQSKSLDHLISDLIESGIKPIIDFIVGLPGDSYPFLIKTVDFLEKKGFLPYSSFYHLLVLPSTEIRNEFIGSGYQFFDKPPYYMIDNKSLTLDDIKNFYFYLETEKYISYYDDFDADPDFPFIKISPGHIGKREPFDQNLFKAIKGNISFSLFISLENNSVFLDSLIELLTVLFKSKVESFIKIYFYLPGNFFLHSGSISGELKDFLYKIKTLCQIRQNYYDYFHESLNFSGDELFSKQMTILAEPAQGHLLFSRFFPDFEMGLLMMEKNGLENQLKSSLSLYKEQGIYTYIIPGFSRFNKSESSFFSSLEFIKFLPEFSCE